MSNAADIINACYDRADALKTEGQFLAAAKVQSVGNLVNSLHHGRDAPSWLPNALRIAKATSRELESSFNEEETFGYTEGIKILEKALNDLNESRIGKKTN